ncbi:MAG: hypothetical protein R3F11_15125 [Verrucomicrobiales bacterium]
MLRWSRRVAQRSVRLVAPGDREKVIEFESAGWRAIPGAGIDDRRGGCAVEFGETSVSVALEGSDDFACCSRRRKATDRVPLTDAGRANSAASGSPTTTG